jgi:hypothetical protein
MTGRTGRAVTTPTIDLDAAKREAAHPEGITIRLGGEDFTLPSELPVDVFDPLLDENLDLVGLIREVLADKDSDLTDDVLRIIGERPSLPKQLIGAVKDCFALLFGAEQYAAFTAKRPSIQDYLRLAKALPSLYGVSLGEAFASPASPESDGATQKPTSEPTAGSTPETSGDEVTPASSDSGESATTS